MPKSIQNYERDKMSNFAGWIYDNLQHYNMSVQELAGSIGIDKSQIYKVLKSYQPGYEGYKALGRDYIRQIGELFSDIEGGFKAAGIEYVKPRTSPINPNEVLSLDERDLISAYRDLSPEDRQTWKEICKILKGARNRPINGSKNEQSRN